MAGRVLREVVLWGCLSASRGSETNEDGKDNQQIRAGVKQDRSPLACLFEILSDATSKPI
jgi:hypothetical protein